jgi:hypothetical protein
LRKTARERERFKRVKIGFLDRCEKTHTQRDASKTQNTKDFASLSSSVPVNVRTNPNIAQRIGTVACPAAEPSCEGSSSRPLTAAVVAKDWEERTPAGCQQQSRRHGGGEVGEQKINILSSNQPREKKLPMIGQRIIRDRGLV